MSGDRDRLAQALDNLVANALRHGAAPVTMTARGRRATRSRSGSSDAGDGVAPAMRDRLFERFATGRGRGGTGLGLFIVRELARAQGGDAVYESGVAGPALGHVRDQPAATPGPRRVSRPGDHRRPE